MGSRCAPGTTGSAWRAPQSAAGNSARPRKSRPRPAFPPTAMRAEMRFRMSRMACGASVRWLFCSPCSTAASTDLFDRRVDKPRRQLARPRQVWLHDPRGVWSAAHIRSAEPGCAWWRRPRPALPEWIPRREWKRARAAGSAAPSAPWPAAGASGTRSSTTLGFSAADAVEQLLGVLAREQLVRVAADQLRQMRAENADAVHNRVSRVARALGTLRRESTARSCRTPARG